ncbi:MAG: sulfotransferase [Crocosphaera sp.]|nr:sulfotransferase [Crocosphaera sp.]
MKINNLHIQLNQLLRRRKFQCYCVGTAKSGTHSIAAIFDDNYRSGHEKEANELINKLSKFLNSSISQKEFTKYIKKRDTRLFLELDSSSINYYLIDILIKEFSNAKFILTIRDCYSWLDSLCNHCLTDEVSPFWHKMRDIRFASGSKTYSKEERVLEENGLYPLDNYLFYWAKHNTDVLNTIPKDKLLVLRTNEISSNLDTLAQFVGVDPNTLSLEKSHAFQARKKLHILEQIDSSFLQEKIDEHCKPLMEEFFPKLNLSSLN